MYMDFALYAIILSVIGARAYYVAFSWDNYKDDLLQIFNLRGGGLAIYGGVIVAFLTALVFCKIKRYKFTLFADTAIVGLITGQIIGRYGNFMNREAFGEYTDSLFAMRIKVSQTAPSNITQTMWEHVETVKGEEFISVHPTFLYESFFNLLLLILMLVRTKKKKFDGEIFLMYIVGYGIIRFFVEGLRTDQLQIGDTGIAISQVLSIVMAVCGLILWIVALIIKRRNKFIPAEQIKPTGDVYDDFTISLNKKDKSDDIANFNNKINEENVTDKEDKLEE